MDVPVIIAARNEEASIANLLEALPKTGVEPIVAANGCVDATADVASRFGATVLEIDEPGKLPAIQHAIGFLAGRGLALEVPILLTDADCQPVSGRHWVESMSKELSAYSGNCSHVTGGVILYRGGKSIVYNAIRSARNLRTIAIDAREGGSQSWPGGNMGIRIGSNDCLETLLGLPHYWPGEDRALHDTLIAQGATDSKLPWVRSAVFADARYVLPLLPRLFMTREERVESARANYALRASEGATPYISRADLAIANSGS